MKNTLKNIAKVGTTIVLLGAFCKFGTSYMNRNLLKPEDFENAKWIEYYNSDGIIWDNYNCENIPEDDANWTAYLSEVQKKNKTKNMEGNILLPDLDGDGKVGRN